MHIFVILTKKNNIYFEINILKLYYLLFHFSYTFFKRSLFENFHVFKKKCMLFDSYQHFFFAFFSCFQTLCD
jgi:hypothetical protein